MKTKKLQLKIIAMSVLYFQLLSFTIHAQMCFAPVTSLPAGGSINYSIINADFNGDYIPDLAIVNSESNSITVLIGNGTGNFVADTILAVGNNPRSIISADFNGDGKVDLATVNAYSNNVSIILGNGSGGFAATTDFAVGSFPHSLISADFNGDGKLDLAVANSSSNNISVLLGDGAGGFGATSDFPVSSFPQSIISADFNGDGMLDLAVVNSDSNNLSVLLGNGAGSFGAASNFVVGNGPCSVISDDFNEDGKTDLATANYGSNNVSILLGNGNGTFGSVNNIPLFSGTYSLISEDFNGDSKKDLAVLNINDNNVSILLGDGIGNFSAATNFTLGWNPRSVTCADFNGDGKIDLAVTCAELNNVDILLNSLPSVTANASVATVCTGTSVTLTGGGATSYTWSGGVTDGIAFVPTFTTTYTVTGTTSGCSYSTTKTITVLPQPTATFITQNESSNLFCDGSIKANLTGGSGIIQPQWLDSVQSVLSSTDSVASLCHGTYTLYLIDSNLCTNTYTQTIQAGPLPPSPPICMVTVDSTYTHNIVVWEKTNLNLAVIDSFIVYREITSNNFQQIGIVLKDSLSTFNDLTANPTTTGFRYKLKSKNTHGVLSAFNDYHNTIYLTNTGGNFSWTPYQVENNLTPISTYNVYRDDNSTGNFQLIGNTTGNQFGYTDIQFSSFPNSSYYVEAVLAGGSCNPTRSSFDGSRSNAKHFSNVGIQQLNKIETINIYPNPANNELTMTGITEKTNLRLYDVVGKIVIEKEVENNTTINTSMVTVGVYTLLTVSKTGRTFNKVVISR